MDFHNNIKQFNAPFLSFFDIPSNLLTYQRCWHIKINLLSALMLNKVKFNDISDMLRFYLIFDP